MPAECGGWRLDHFLKRRIGRLSRTKIQAIIGEQISFSDGRTVRPAASVRAGETIRLRRPAPVEPPVPRDFGILYQDESVLVIDKPAGLPMHTTAKFWRNTLTAVLRERYPDEQMEMAHRIDRETSGVLLIARGRDVASFLTRAFARRAVDKTYLALVKGHPPDQGRIDRPLKLLDTRSHVMMGVAADGLPAVTTYQVLRRFADHALCAAHPETGRQHQIRVHFQSIGHPIVGDKLYGAERGAVHAFVRSGGHARAARRLRRAAAARPARASPDVPAPGPARARDRREPAAGRSDRLHRRACSALAPYSSPLASTRETLRSRLLRNRPARDRNSDGGSPRRAHTSCSAAASTSARARAIHRLTVDWLTL